MANVIFPKTLLWMLDQLAAIGTLRFQLIDTADLAGGVYDNNDAFLSDIPLAARVGPAVALTPTTTEDGTQATLDAADLTFSSVTGDDCEAVILYADTGDEATSRLIAWLDVTVAPNGQDVNATIDASGVLTLG